VKTGAGTLNLRPSFHLQNQPVGFVWSTLDIAAPGVVASVARGPTPLGEGEMSTRTSQAPRSVRFLARRLLWTAAFAAVMWTAVTGGSFALAASDGAARGQVAAPAQQYETATPTPVSYETATPTPVSYETATPTPTGTELAATPTPAVPTPTPAVPTATPGATPTSAGTATPAGGELPGTPTPTAVVAGLTPPATDIQAPWNGPDGGFLALVLLALLTGAAGLIGISPPVRRARGRGQT
jgi:hypothetical protein